MSKYGNNKNAGSLFQRRNVKSMPLIFIDFPLYWQAKMEKLSIRRACRGSYNLFCCYFSLKDINVIDRSSSFQITKRFRRIQTCLCQSSWIRTLYVRKLPNALYCRCSVPKRICVHKWSPSFRTFEPIHFALPYPCSFRLLKGCKSCSLWLPEWFFCSSKLFL